MVDPLEQAGVPPCIEMALNAAVRRENAGQRSPLTASSKQIKDRFKQQAQLSLSGRPRRHRDGQ